MGDRDNLKVPTRMIERGQKRDADHGLIKGGDGDQSPLLIAVGKNMMSMPEDPAPDIRFDLQNPGIGGLDLRAGELREFVSVSIPRPRPTKHVRWSGLVGVGQLAAAAKDIGETIRRLALNFTRRMCVGIRPDAGLPQRIPHGGCFRSSRRDERCHEGDTGIDEQVPLITTAAHTKNESLALDVDETVVGRRRLKSHGSGKC